MTDRWVFPCSEVWRIVLEDNGSGDLVISSEVLRDGKWRIETPDRGELWFNLPHDILPALAGAIEGHLGCEHDIDSETNRCKHCGANLDTAKEMP